MIQIAISKSLTCKIFYLKFINTINFRTVTRDGQGNPFVTFLGFVNLLLTWLLLILCLKMVIWTINYFETQVKTHSHFQEGRRSNVLDENQYYGLGTLLYLFTRLASKSRKFILDFIENIIIFLDFCFLKMSFKKYLIFYKIRVDFCKFWLIKIIKTARG